ncbi:protein phosphatase methylesterase [Meredithblackwellia eburnea MCA 4105]
MQRDLLKARFSQLPPLPPLESGEGEEEQEETEELDEVPETLARPLPTARRRRDQDRYSPLSAEGYFAEALEIDLPTTTEGSQSTFRVYYTPPAPKSERTAPSPSVPPPAPVYDGPATAPWARQSLAHGLGAGHSPKGGNGMVLVCVHGAGYSGLSFACFAKDAVQKGGGKVGALAFDARGHGKTKVLRDGDKPLDMSLETMSNDLVQLLKAMFPVKADAPSVLLVGHSMGGAVAVDACPKLAEVVEVVGIAVIDVVEGTAMDALQGMNALIAAQPKGFQSVEQGIEWHLRSKAINNSASARISVPPLLVQSTTQQPGEPLSMVWKADLAATQPFWEGWFTGLSSKFLACRTAKLLLLAGADHLDTELMVGQMQGKYQLEVFTEVGHCVQEDAPEKTADLLLSFWVRNDRTDILKGVKKVGET